MNQIWQCSKDYDIVYFVKPSPKNEELKYSLRSLKNFPYNRVFFFGGCPAGLQPDVQVSCVQNMGSKYLNVRNMLQQAIKHGELSENFWLFNDDFFIMSPVSYVKPVFSGSLSHKIQLIELKYGHITPYTRRLRKTAKVLINIKKDILNYEMHLPMLVNKKKAADLFKTFASNVAFRSTYGNYYKIGGELEPDVKILSRDTLPNPDIHNVFLSTSDESFAYGLVGNYIKSTFTERSKYEKD